MRSASLLVVVALVGCRTQELPPPDLSPASHGDLAMPVAGDLGVDDAFTQHNADLPSPGLIDGGPVGENVVAVIVDNGPEVNGQFLGAYNVPYISIKLCIAGTTTCQIVDHVSVDTGSSGLRVLAQALPSDFIAQLGQAKSSTNDPLAECYTFADGFVWGSVRVADLTVGGEQAPSMAFELVGDPTYGKVPKNCSDTGPSEDTLDTFGANGLIGVGTQAADCGSACEDQSQFGEGYFYYSCASPTTCKQIVVPPASQVTNPTALFPVDNNGVMLQMPALPEGGALNPTGVLVFGIGTQGNNGLGNANIYPAGDQASVDVKLNGRDYSFAFFDSGSTDYSFGDDSIPQCSGMDGYDCPSSTLALVANIVDVNGTARDIDFRVANADELLSVTNASAYDDIAFNSSSDDPSFDFGMPFFYGRTVFTSIEGASTPGGTGPYFAF